MRHFQKRAGRVRRSIWCREREIRPSANSRCDPPKKGSRNKNFSFFFNFGGIKILLFVVKWFRLYKYSEYQRIVNRDERPKR